MPYTHLQMLYANLHGPVSSVSGIFGSRISCVLRTRIGSGLEGADVLRWLHENATVVSARMDAGDIEVNNAHATFGFRVQPCPCYFWLTCST